MFIILSITGLFKMVLLLIGIFVLLRFIGQLMLAKRNLAEHNALQDKLKKEQKMKHFVEKNKGKIFISKKDNNSVQDVDYEEM